MKFRPLYLHYKYKIDNTFGFYFFDDFNLRSKKEITRYFLSFYDKNKFKKFKVKNQTDIIGQSQFAGSYSLADIDRLISKDNVVLTNKLINGQAPTKKTQKSKILKSSTLAEQKIRISSGDVNRFFYKQKTTETTKENTSSASYRTFQTPDNEKNSNERMTLAKDSIEKKVERIDEFSTNNCGFEWLQFGTLYSMNENKPNDFLHTPISIVNIFHRTNSKENILSHMMRYMMIKFKADESSENSSSDGLNNNKNTSTVQKIKEKINSTSSTDSALLERKLPINSEIIERRNNLNRGDWRDKFYAGQIQKINKAPTITGPITNNPSKKMMA